VLVVYVPSVMFSVYGVPLSVSYLIPQSDACPPSFCRYPFSVAVVSSMLVVALVCTVGGLVMVVPVMVRLVSHHFFPSGSHVHSV